MARDGISLMEGEEEEVFNPRNAKSDHLGAPETAQKRSAQNVLEKNVRRKNVRE
jgi:hypothetical protein